MDPRVTDWLFKSPELAHIEELDFSAAFTVAQSVLTITNPEKYAIPDGYFYTLLGVSGYIEEPGMAVANFVNILWNINRNAKRGVFGNDQVMSRLLDINGSKPPIWYPYGAFRFMPGEQLQVKFAQRTSTTWNGGTKRVGVVLTLLGLHHSLVA